TARGDGEAWCAVAEDRLLNHRLNQLFCGGGRFIELFGAHAMDQLMVQTVAADFMTALMDLANQPRITPRHPSEHEKRRLGTIAIQQVQQAVRAGLDSG